MLDLAQTLRLEADFALRKTLKWSRSGYTDTEAPLENPINAEEAALHVHYPSMAALKKTVGESRYRENMNLLSLLQQASEALYPQPEQKPLRCLEIGVKNWISLPATVSFLERLHAGPITLTGIEIDCWRVYENGFSRQDALNFHINNVQAHKRTTTMIESIEGDIKEHHEPYDLILWFLPFVFPEQVEAWGLPARLSQPKALLKHVVNNNLTQGGQLITTHQGEMEASIHHHIAKRLNLHAAKHFIARQDFHHWAYPRHTYVYKKTD